MTTATKTREAIEYTLAPVTHAQIGRALRIANGQVSGIEGGRFVYDGEAIWWAAFGCQPDVVATIVASQRDAGRKLLIQPDVATEYPVFFNVIHDTVEGER